MTQEYYRRMTEGINFNRIRPGQTFLLHGKFYQKIQPVQVGYTRAMQPKYHNCIDIHGKTGFLYACLTVLPVEFKDIRANGSGKLLFRYAAEYGLIEIKPKGEERPLLIKLN